MSRDVVNAPEGQELSTRRGVATRWLEAFAASVRDRDFAAGRAMFAENVIGFGSVTVRADGIDELADAQWGKVWPVTRGFAFNLPTLSVGGDGRTTWAAVQWSSYGHDAAGTEFLRRGRVTIILEEIDGRLLARHTHYSLDPASLRAELDGSDR